MKEGGYVDIKYKLKNSIMLRTVVKPYMDIKRKQDYYAYICTSDSLKIKKFRNIHEGKRCFFVGNGPSLDASVLTKLEHEYTFASNRIYEVFDKTNWRPTYYFAVDNDFIMNNIEELKRLDAEYLFLALNKGLTIENAKDNIIRIFEYTDFKINKWNDLTAHISEDVSKYFSVGYTVAFTAIQMAIYMGFNEIYLLGVDFNYSVVRDKYGRIRRNDTVNDYFSGKKYSSTVLNYNSALNAYENAREYAENHNIHIMNATNGGKLEVFKRVDFDSLF